MKLTDALQAQLATLNQEVLVLKEKNCLLNGNLKDADKRFDNMLYAKDRQIAAMQEEIQKLTTKYKKAVEIAQSLINELI